VSVNEAIARRRSVRSFARTPVTPTQVSQLCWAAQGVTEPGEGLRSAPSAGALYPIHMLLADAAGVSEYDPRGHALRALSTADARGALEAAAYGQDFVSSAPLVMIIAFDEGRTASKYGRRARQYCFLEAGHVAQNVLLQATAMDVAGVPVGAFDDAEVARAVGLPARLTPAYLLPLGAPP
jgi:SagB-type dehydrogenase family enzyme